MGGHKHVQAILHKKEVKTGTPIENYHLYYDYSHASVNANIWISIIYLKYITKNVFKGQRLGFSSLFI